MDWKKINLPKYVAEVKKNMPLALSDEMVTKDLLLSLLLAEFEKEQGVFTHLIFKGGTLLSRNHLQYHRFSEDLDFVHQDSNELRELSRHKRERKIKEFIDLFVPQIKTVAETLGLDFSTNRSDTRYCTILSGRTVYILRVYYGVNNYVKIEVNFIEKMIYKPQEVMVKGITDYFDSQELRFILGLHLDNFRVRSYALPEIVLEKYRAVLTRPVLKERDLFDLFLIPHALQVNIPAVVEKIHSAALIKKKLKPLLTRNLIRLQQDEFFTSDEAVEDLALVKYNPARFAQFKHEIKPILMEICKSFLER